MAYSSSQAIKLCELCDEDNIKWRCMDCDRCLCQKCKTIHLKVPVTAKHQIVTIATPIQDVQRKIVTDNIPCKNHVTKMHCLFCKTCDSLVCPECVSISHTKHQFIPIERALDGKLEQLKGNKAKVSDNLKFCDSKTREIQNLVPKYDSIFDESVTKIKQKEQELKDEITKFSKLLQGKVEVERSKVKTVVKKVEQEILISKKRLEDMSRELETALTSNQGEIIFDINFVQPFLKFDPILHKVENFIPKAKTEIQIEEVFGSFQTVMIPKIQPELGFEVLKTFTTDLPAIKQVMPLDETTAWVSCYTSAKKVTRKMTIQDNDIITSNKTSLTILDMTLTSDHAILLTTVEESGVKLMKKSGQVKPFLTLTPILSIGIHLTSENKVIVGVAEPGPTFTPTDPSQRAVLVYGMNCKQEHIYQYDNDEKRLFTIPYRITTNNNQDILVIDFTSDSSSRMVTLDRDGNIRWIYEGHPKINTTQLFHPMGITTTSAGYIIVTDYSTHALHVLSENGEVLTCRVMDDMGIVNPMGLDLDRAGSLWVGCNSCKDSGAKLHIVKLLT